MSGKERTLEGQEAHPLPHTVPHTPLTCTSSRPSAPAALLLLFTRRMPWMPDRSGVGAPEEVRRLSSARMKLPAAAR